jgi:hypothetical protein
MKIKRIPGGVALVTITLLFLLIMMLGEPLLRLWILFELRENDCQTEAPVIFMNGPATNFEWKEVTEVELTIFYNCSGEPVRLYMSKDETTLFIRRDADRDTQPKEHRGFWSDVIDVSIYPPKLIRGLGGCCMEETVVPKEETNKFIENMAKEKGVVVKTF